MGKSTQTALGGELPPSPPKPATIQNAAQDEPFSPRAVPAPSHDHLRYELPEPRRQMPTTPGLTGLGISGIQSGDPNTTGANQPMTAQGQGTWQPFSSHQSGAMSNWGAPSQRCDEQSRPESRGAHGWGSIDDVHSTSSTRSPLVAQSQQQQQPQNGPGPAVASDAEAKSPVTGW